MSEDSREAELNSALMEHCARLDALNNGARPVTTSARPAPHGKFSYHCHGWILPLVLVLLSLVVILAAVALRD
jgi:hypothetical protein